MVPLKGTNRGGEFTKDAIETSNWKESGEPVKTIPVTIYIFSKASRNEAMPEEDFNMMVSGELALKNDAARLTYDEINEEENEHVAIVFCNDAVTINRIGNFSSQMFFSPGCRSEGFYHTPYGDMMLAVYCNLLSYDITEDGGQMDLSYQLDMNGQYAAQHTISMRIEVKDEGVSRNSAGAVCVAEETSKPSILSQKD